MREIILEDNPRVSIVVPVYNGEKYLAQTLDCLLKQTFGAFEILIVDDGSTDNTQGIINQFLFDRRIRTFKKLNGGTGSALNLGHENARGEYITWCSADNVYFPQFLEVLYCGLEQAKAAGANIQLVYSDFAFMTEDGKKIRDVIHQQPQRGKDLVEGYDIGMSFMYTRVLWLQAGPYWHRICEDYEWVVRAAQYTSFGLINAVLAAFRVHPKQISGHRQAEEKAAAYECKELARKLYGDK
jgi:glycosyltransferase involved in cell wall biosynthesis